MWRAQRRNTAVRKNGLRRRSERNERFNAGWSSPVARQAHNLKVVGSNPTPATKQCRRADRPAAFFFDHQADQRSRGYCSPYRHLIVRRRDTWCATIGKNRRCPNGHASGSPVRPTLPPALCQIRQRSSSSGTHLGRYRTLVQLDPGVHARDNRSDVARMTRAAWAPLQPRIAKPGAEICGGVVFTSML